MAVVDCDSADEEGNDEGGAVQGEMMTAELLGDKLYICLALTPTKGKKRSKLRKRRHICLTFQKQIRYLTS